MCFVVVPNWNLSFKPKIFKTLSGLKKYFYKENIILSEVTSFEESEYYSKKYHGMFSYTDSIFVGW